ncbi:MAG: heme biosynthesis HemY N-terminal domain-containing protein [Pseudomonadota bacterium]
MFRIVTFLLIVLALALLFAWVADNPGTIFIQWEWLAVNLGRHGEEVGVPLTLAVSLLVGLIAAVMFLTGLLKGIFGMPSLLARFFDNRRRERGYRALSRGLIAASSGDVDTARSLAKESGKLLKNEPLVALLGTQTALLEGKRDEARANFQTMLEDENTRMVALRGLFLEAERQGEAEAARHYAEEAAKDAPALPWAGTAKLRYQASDGDWDSAISTLEANRSAGLVDRNVAKRQRAVLLTAKAMTQEQANPEDARKLAKEAHKLAKDLVPAATSYARSATRLGDIRGASKILEATWKLGPHPEIAEAYSTVRAGDSVQDRLKRAKRLASLKTNHPEGNLAVAIAAIDAKEWDTARSSLEPVLTTRPTERACLLMADIEEGQHGDKGRMRDWLSRAVRAPADEAWTADGHVSEEWLPMSPVTGEVDAFEWRIPVAQLGDETAPVMTLEELKAEAQPIEEPEVIEDSDDDVIEAETVSDEIQAEQPVNESDKAEDAEVSTADVTDEPEYTEARQSEAADTAVETAPEPEEPVVKPDDVEEATVISAESANDNIASGTAGAEVSETVDKAAEATVEQPAANGVEAMNDLPEEGFENQVKFPLERRPDDPGVHPDKEPPKKNFKLF